MQAFHHIEISNFMAGPNLLLGYPILHTTDRRRKDNIKTRSIKLTDRKQTVGKTDPIDRTDILDPLAVLIVIGKGRGIQFWSKEM